jgi:thiol-disulfide isomerase/thioredoxin
MRSRVTALLVSSLALLSACSDGNDAPPSRSDMVLGSGSQGPSAAVSTSASSAPLRKVCQVVPTKAGERPAPVKLGHVEAPGEAALGEELPSGDGKWTWINVWAGWCEPCVEEIPLLHSWETKLADRLRVVFVSFVDDPRLAERFLKSQPKTGVRRSYHLLDLERRRSWLQSLGLADNALLPVQILLDPEGAIRCISQGRILAGNLPEVEALVRR